MPGITQWSSGLSWITKSCLRGAATYTSFVNPSYRNRITVKGPDNQPHAGYVQDIRDDAVWVRFKGGRRAEWIPKDQINEDDRQRILHLDKLVYEVRDPEMQRIMEKLSACEALQAVQREVKPKDDVAFVGISGSTITVLKSRELPWSNIMSELESHYDEKMEDAKEADPSKACTSDGVNVVLDQSQLHCGYSDTHDFRDHQVYHEHVDHEFLDLLQRSVTASTRTLTLRSILSDGFLMKILCKLKRMGIKLDTLILKDSNLILQEYIEIVDWPRHWHCEVPGNLPARTLALQNVTLGHIFFGLMRGRHAKFNKWRRGSPMVDVDLVITNDQIPLKDNGVESRALIECFERYCPELSVELEEKAQTEWARLTTWKQPLNHPYYRGPPNDDIEDLRKMLQWFEVGKGHFPPDVQWDTVDLQTISPKSLRRLTWQAVAVMFAQVHLRAVEEFGEYTEWDAQTRTWGYKEFKMFNEK